MTEQMLDGLRAVSVRRLGEHVGRRVLVQGWLYNMRSKGKLHFLLIRDGTGIVQSVMFKGDVSTEEFEAAAHLPQESSVRVIGTVKADERAPGGVELSAASHRQFWVPPGFGHGFVVLSPSAVFTYKCTDIYDASAELGVRWDDPDLAIDWPIPRDEVLASKKDDALPFLRDLPHERLLTYEAHG